MTETLQVPDDRRESSHETELDASFQQWQSVVDRLEAETTDTAAGQGMPEWYQQEAISFAQITAEVKGSDDPAAYAASCVDLLGRQARLMEMRTGMQMSEALTMIEMQLGTEVMGEAFRREPEDGVLHQTVLRRLDEPKPRDTLLTEIAVLQQAYGAHSAIELLGIKGGEYETQVRARLLQDAPLQWIKHADSKTISDESWQATKNRTHDWMTEAVRHANGLEADEARAYTFTAAQRGDVTKVVRAIEKIDYFGAERLRVLTAATGIKGLEGYTVRQLERMEALVTDPVSEAARLADHDVTVVLINRVGDDVGIMEGTAERFDDEHERTVFLEIENMADIYRKMSYLHGLGVEPSTVVLAAHSAPGQFIVSDKREADNPQYDIATIAGRQLVRMAVEKGRMQGSERGYSMHGMKGLSRLVTEYMRPSRGIDDATDDIGRKKFIFEACFAGTEVDMNDRDSDDVPVKIGMSSVIKRLGQDLSDAGTDMKVDIYGAPGGIQMHKTESGVRYSATPAEFGASRTPLDAVRISVNGADVAERHVSEIPLRKAA